MVTADENQAVFSFSWFFMKKSRIQGMIYQKLFQ